VSGARLRLPLVLLFGLLQLAVPVHRIIDRETTLREGTPWRFRTAPVDPADAFRGNYLALGFENVQAVVPKGLEVNRGDHVVVPLLRDAQDFARFGEVRTSPPAAGDWLRVRVSWDFEDLGVHTAHLDLPFDRFYLDERLAPQAEAAFAALRNSSGARPAWALVRVRDGDAVLEDVLVGGRSVRGSR
jgi:uncharacterized membrane-anchored protein